MTFHRLLLLSAMYLSSYCDSYVRIMMKSSPSSLVYKQPPTPTIAMSYAEDLQLNEIQKAAVEISTQHTRVIAGPGSGKTRVIVYRIAHLLKAGAKPESILAVTFTRKAAEEMRERITNVIGKELAAKVQIHTLHAFCSLLLRRFSSKPNFTIYDDRDVLQILRRLTKESRVAEDEVPIASTLSTLRESISFIKREGISRSSTKSLKIDRFLSALEMLDSYQIYLNENNAKDFDDLILDATKVLTDKSSTAALYIAKKLLHVLIDEWQDLDAAQFRLIRALTSLNLEISTFVVGDSNQVIYSWRGANSKNFDNYAAIYPNCATVEMRQNYRSSRSIQRASDKIINASLMPTINSTDLVEVNKCEVVKVVQTYSDIEQSSYVCRTINHLKKTFNPSEIAILVRRRSQMVAIESALISMGIPYTVLGGYSILERTETKDLLAYLNFITNNRDLFSFSRIINTPSRGIGDATQQLFLSACAKYLSDTDNNLHDIIRKIASEDFSKENINKIKTGTSKDAYDLVLKTIASSIAPIRLKNLSVVCTLFNKLYHLVNEWQGSIEELIGVILHNTGLWEHIGHLQSNDNKKIGSRTSVIDKILIMASIADKYDEPDELLLGALPRLRKFLDLFLLNNDVIASNRSGVENVVLSTVHATKGLEFDCVIITGLEEGSLPMNGAITQAVMDTTNESVSKGKLLVQDSEQLQDEEERRLLYVGMTRARKVLTLTYRSKQILGKRHIPLKQSRFLSELLESSTITSASPSTKCSNYKNSNNYYLASSSSLVLFQKYFE